jgi:hypothetical protein
MQNGHVFSRFLLTVLLIYFALHMPAGQAFNGYNSPLDLKNKCPSVIVAMICINLYIRSIDVLKHLRTFSDLS